MKKTWIPGYEGRYSVSTCGEVESELQGGKILKQFKVGKNRNYLAVKLYNEDGSHSQIGVHILVARTFIPNAEGLPQVNHKDENGFNNNVDNLEWITLQKNVEYSQAKTYKAISPDGVFIGIRNLSKFCRDNDLTNGGVYQAIRNNSTHKNWRFEKT